MSITPDLQHLLDANAKTAKLYYALDRRADEAAFAALGPSERIATVRANLLDARALQQAHIHQAASYGQIPTAEVTASDAAAIERAEAELELATRRAAEAQQAANDARQLLRNVERLLGQFDPGRA